MGASKANRIRAFLEVENDFIVAKFIEKILEYIKEEADSPASLTNENYINFYKNILQGEFFQRVLEIKQKLLESTKIIKLLK